MKNKIRKVIDIMVVVYVTLILKNRKTINDVPSVIRQDVIDMLKDLEVDVENL